MNIAPECITCIFSQSLKVAKTLNLDEKKTKELLDLSSSFIPKFNQNQNPPVNATMMYEALAKFLNTDDIYKDAKLKATKKAKELLKIANKMLKESKDKLTDAAKISIAGNVIDLATQTSFPLEEELENILTADFAIKDFDLLNQKLKNSKKIAYFADNAGEHIFDKLYLQTIKEYFPNLEIFYFTRGNAIINDVTFQEAKNDKLDKYCTIINSGVNTPCIIFNNMSKEAFNILNSCDFIISKGMGNYECLNEEFSKEIFFLMKVKCEVVANSLNLKVKDLVALYNKRLQIK